MCIVGIFTISTFISCGGDDEGPFSEYNNNGNGNGSGNNNSSSGSDNTGSNKGLSISGYHNNRAYVDLGLSVKWATCNIGACEPYETGGYYAWGETSTKNIYDVDHSKWLSWTTTNPPINVSKYCTDSNYGRVDGKITLEKSDDVAFVYWRGNWRMPTKDEIQKLVENCTLEWCESGNKEYNGIAGMKFISKINGNYIFFPASGLRNSKLEDFGTDGYYWTSSLGYDGAICACNLWVFNKVADVNEGSPTRWEGLQVRAVCP